MRRSEIILIAVFAACVSFQLFVPPSIGLANNGDFGKLIGRFSLGPESRDDSDQYRYFATRWAYDHNLYWMSDTRSSELIPISAAVLIGWWFSTGIFDIRILGAIHALLWIGCFAVFLTLLRRLGTSAGYATAILALFVLTDVSYVANFNSFYMDTAAFLFLAWSLVLWLHIMVRQRPSASGFALFCLAAILCVSSKAQHAPLALFLFPLAMLAAFCFEGMRRKIGALAAALLLPLVAAVTMMLAPPGDTWEGPVWSVISMKILKNSPTPLEDARELGLGPEHLAYAGRWPSQPSEDPMQNPAWRADFVRRTGPWRLVRFYLRHPWRALVIVYHDLQTTASKRPLTFGHYERQSGLPPFSQPRSFAWWSLLRSALFRLAPWHIILWYSAVFAVAVRLAVRHRGTALAHVATLCVLLIGMGLTELAISTLTDTGETERHMLLFHFITDFTVLPVVAWAVTRRTASTA